MIPRPLHRRHFLALAAAVPAAFILTRPALAAEPQTFAVDGVAIRGTDPVAYFTNGAVVKGSPEHAYDWNGASWQFASAEKRALFVENPEAYAPQFGGYCAFALSKGALASTVPEAWTIYEGKLYLNYSLEVRQIWKQEIPTNIERATAYWPAILG